MNFICTSGPAKLFQMCCYYSLNCKLLKYNRFFFSIWHPPYFPNIKGVWWHLFRLTNLIKRHHFCEIQLQLIKVYSFQLNLKRCYQTPNFGLPQTNTFLLLQSILSRNLKTYNRTMWRESDWRQNKVVSTVAFSYLTVMSDIIYCVNLEGSLVPRKNI